MSADSGDYKNDCQQNDTSANYEKKGNALQQYSVTQGNCETLVTQRVRPIISRYFIVRFSLGLIPLTVFKLIEMDDPELFTTLLRTVLYLILMFSWCDYFNPIRFALVSFLVENAFKYLTESKHSLNMTFCGHCGESCMDGFMFFLPMFYIICQDNLYYIVNMNVLIYSKLQILFSPFLYIIYWSLFFTIVYVLSYYYLMIARYGCTYFLVDNNITFIEVNVSVRQDRNDLKPLRKFEKTLVYTSYNNINTVFGHEAKLKTIKTVMGQAFPICREELIRVENEDAYLMCGFDSHFYEIELGKYNISIESKHFQAFQWELDDIIVNDFRQHVIYNDRSRSILAIIALSEKHFKYEFILWAIYSSSIGKIKLKLGSFFIQREKEFVMEVYAPTGHIINIRNMVVFTFSNVTDIMVGHHISSFVSENVSGDTDLLCATEFQGCRPVAYYLYNKTAFLRTNGLEINSAITYDTNIPIVKMVEDVSCVCENAYGIHRFFILRDIDNYSMQSYISQILLPVKIIVLPIGFVGNMNDGYAVIKSRVMKSIIAARSNWEVFGMYTLREYAIYYYLKFDAEGIIGSIVLIVTLITIMQSKRLAKEIAKLKQKRVSQRKALVEEEHISECESIGNFETDIQIRYHVLVLNSDDDYEFTTQILILFFSKFENLEVFHPNRDINGGQPIYQAYCRAVMSSQIYVIVGTTNFETDSWNNEFVLSRLILPIIFDSPQGEHHILIIKWNDVNIPLPLSWNKDVTVAEWSDRLDINENLRTLRKGFMQVIKKRKLP